MSGSEMGRQVQEDLGRQFTSRKTSVLFARAGLSCLAGSHLCMAGGESMVSQQVRSGLFLVQYGLYFLLKLLNISGCFYPGLSGLCLSVLGPCWCCQPQDPCSLCRSHCP